ncbi:hypothetical protein VNO77_16445 [Canavalia gladiata]|uniref:Uncharacterized protein n=1 Tax=Canavalia gladiata TaxID=3824 RepID=A0AAN9M5W0_CANGL
MLVTIMYAPFCIRIKYLFSLLSYIAFLQKLWQDYLHFNEPLYLIYMFGSFVEANSHMGTWNDKFKCSYNITQKSKYFNGFILVLKFVQFSPYETSSTIPLFNFLCVG